MQICVILQPWLIVGKKWREQILCQFKKNKKQHIMQLKYFICDLPPFRTLSATDNKVSVQLPVYIHTIIILHVRSWSNPAWFSMKWKKEAGRLGPVVHLLACLHPHGSIHYWREIRHCYLVRGSSSERQLEGPDSVSVCVLYSDSTETYN